MPLNKTQLKTLIDSIDTEIAARVGGRPVSYTIENRSLQKMTVEALEMLRTKRTAELNALENIDSITAGRANKNKIKTKF